MNISKQMAQAAIEAGMAITDAESGNFVSMKHMRGVLILRQLLEGLSNGDILFASPRTVEEPTDD